MNQDSAGMDRSPDVPRAAPRRWDGADTGNESPPASGNGALGADALLDPLRLNDAVRHLWSRLAADPAPLVGTWLELSQSWERAMVVRLRAHGRRRRGTGCTPGRERSPLP